MMKPVRELVIIFLPFSWDSLSAAPANIVKPPMTSIPKRMRPAMVKREGSALLIMPPILSLPLLTPMALL